MCSVELLEAIDGPVKEQNLSSAIDSIVAGYYQEYTDADEMDQDFELSLKTIFDVLFPCGENADGLSFEEITKKRDK